MSEPERNPPTEEPVVGPDHPVRKFGPGSTRRGSVMAAAALAVLIAGVAVIWALTEHQDPLVPQSALHAQNWPPTPSSIPDAAYLRHEDLMVRDTYFYDSPQPKYKVMTCDAPARERLAARTRLAVAYPHDAFEETLTLFSGNGAVQYLADVRAAIGRCANVREADDAARGELLESTPRAVVFKATYQHHGLTGTEHLQEKTTYYAVVLVAPDMVLTLGDLGWEDASADWGFFEKVMPRAVKRAETWRRAP